MSCHVCARNTAAKWYPPHQEKQHLTQTSRGWARRPAKRDLTKSLLRKLRERRTHSDQQITAPFLLSRIQVRRDGRGESQNAKENYRQTDRQIVLYFSNNTQYTIALFCSEAEGCTNILSSRAPAAHTPRQHERLGVLHTHHPTYLREAWLRRTTKRQ